jgi:septation ring formation regulator EzrA
MSAWSEIGATLLGLGGLAFGWRERGRTFEHERTLSDLAAVRDVIEEGAVYLHRVAYALDLVNQDLLGNATEANAKLAKLGMTYDEISERLKVRLAPHHEVTQKFVGTVEAALEATQVVQRVVVLHLRNLEKGESAAKQVMTLVEKDRAVLTSARSRFDAHRREFIDAGARTAGANLPSRR